MSGPLAGISIIDMTRVLAGPFCTMMLADMGAEVIKVERPGSGDDSRAFGPFVNGESAYFMSINRGKKSVTLDLKSAEGKALLLSLIDGADVLVENFKPGVMKKLGLDYEVLHARNPRLIYAASTGFGQTGPYSARPAYDLVIQAMGGIMSITGPDAAHPTKVGTSISDISAGVFTCIGILAALNHRHRTGEGQMVDVAMLDCMVAMLENAVARFAASGVSPLPIGNRHPSITPFSTLTTSDGMLAIACGNDALFQRFCNLIGRDGLPTDERFATNAARTAHWADLEPLLNEAMGQQSKAHWMEVFEKAAIPCGPINDIEALSADPQVIARQMLVDVVHPIAGPLKVPGAPIKFSESKAEVHAPAPVLGADNADIFGKRLGLSQEKLDALKANGVI
ncbi:MAG: CoA transferase [Myxococcales bacterium]|jgi:CoA:oxalate CoA-transferase|nr:CoA transferase [Myxococcales bacterium]